MRRLKTSWIVIANIALMSAILVFVALYSNYPESVKPNAKNGSEPKKRRGESEKDIM